MSRDARETAAQPALAAAHELGTDPVRAGGRCSRAPHAEAWLDELLMLSARTAADRPRREESRAKSCVESGGASCFPECAVGACVVDAGGEPVVELRHAPEPKTRSRVAIRPGCFRDFAHENVFELGGDLVGATLHVASQNPSLELATLRSRPRSPNARRASCAAGSATPSSFQRARQSSLDVQRLQAKFIQAEKLASLGPDRGRRGARAEQSADLDRRLFGLPAERRRQSDGGDAGRRRAAAAHRRGGRAHPQVLARSRRLRAALERHPGTGDAARSDRKGARVLRARVQREQRAGFVRVCHR